MGGQLRSCRTCASVRYHCVAPKTSLRGFHTCCFTLSCGASVTAFSIMVRAASLAPIPAPRTGLRAQYRCLGGGKVASGLVAFGVVSFGVTDLGLAVSEIWKAASLVPILAPTGVLCRELERASAALGALERLG